MANSLKKKFCATAIGSVPHVNPSEICSRILDSYKDIPFWPQLPKRTFLENMYVQFMEGFPCAVIDEDKKKVWIDTSKDLMGGIEKAYHKIIEEDFEYFGMSERYAQGFYEFLAQARKRDLSGISYVKGHVTGPISFGLSVTDEKKQSILYHPELSEVLSKILAIKARYQIRKLKEISDDIIIFIDEPYLVSIGSSVVNINKEDVIAKIGETVQAIHEEGALAGVHCCGNTDWSILLELGIDILNFDAYGYVKSLSLYPEALTGYLKKGGSLAWGIVPTSEDAKKETPETLFRRIEEGVSTLESKGIEKKLILDSIVVTPSCGCGTMTEGEANNILTMNAEVSGRLREAYG